MKYLRAIEAAGGAARGDAAARPRRGRRRCSTASAASASPAAPTSTRPPTRRRRHPQLGPTEPDLDRFELARRRARPTRRGLPILAICRGMQAINVARGGTLHQHLPDRARRRDRAPSERARATGSRTRSTSSRARSWRACSAARRLRVNSFHHQAVRKLGRGLRAVAWAPDGVIEGLEAPAQPFLLGVQWHAECLAARRCQQMALFRAFVRRRARPPARGSRSRGRREHGARGRVGGVERRQRPPPPTRSGSRRR